jgi:sporulation protein YqfC
LKSDKKDKVKWYKKVFREVNLKKNISNARDKFSSFIDLPSEVASNTTKITMIEDKDIMIEGYKQIIDYYDNYIKIKAQNIDIVVDGEELDIKEITDFELVIGGKIYSVNYKR